jgi:hypothetical protein
LFLNLDQFESHPDPVFFRFLSVGDFMPTSYTDQFLLMDPAAPPTVGTALTPVSYELVDQADDGDIDRFDGDTVNGVDVTRSWPGDTVTLDVPGSGLITYTGTTFYLADGSRVFTPTDGQVLQAGDYHSASFVTSQGPLDVADLGPPCFVSGTLMATPHGLRVIEDLSEGDVVITADHGPQTIRWAGSREVAGVGDFAPIRFAPGALDNTRELLVSPQHRMLVTGWRAQMYFGEDEVLVAAKHLVNHDTIHVLPKRRVIYHHILFDHHEVVFAEGAPSESFLPGPTILAEDAALQNEILTLFPELAVNDGDNWLSARCVLKGHEGRVLAM